MRHLKFYFILLSILAVANPIRAVQYGAYKPVKNASKTAYPVVQAAAQNTNETIVPMASNNSTLFRHTASSSARTASNASSVSRTTSVTSATSILGSLSAERAKKGATAKSVNMSGGISASGLMSSGSKYARTEDSSASTASTTISRPRRIPDPKDPFLDEEEEEDTPLGDVAIPLLLLACAYIIYIHIRKRKRA